MILYRGSNVAVKTPQILQSGRRLDFGTGFYLTNSREQAERWAKLTTLRRASGTPTVSVFEIDENAYSGLRIKSFARPDARWLRYVASFRQGSGKEETADVVTGPVANDQTAPTISMFLSGTLTLAETIRRLKPQQLKNQYAFKTEKALALLHFVESLSL